ncbi:MAG TPA: hypothetical protein VMU15_19050 [Anaeromyxobacter sp.]|nr:hypothetical protein [Anaeromyxobacter sp.]
MDARPLVSQLTIKEGDDTMPAIRTLFLSLAFSLAPGLALAAGHPAGDGGERSTGATVARASLDPATLGKIEGILNYCAKVSARAPSKERAAIVRGDASEKELSEARSSPEYQACYEEVSAALDGVSRDQAQEACGELSGGN